MQRPPKESYLVEHVNAIRNAAYERRRADDVFNLLKGRHLMLVAGRWNGNSGLGRLSALVSHFVEDSHPLERPLDLVVRQPLAGQKIPLLDKCAAGDLWIVEKIHGCDDLENKIWLRLALDGHKQDLLQSRGPTPLSQ